MSLTADRFLDRMKLKAEAVKWRNAAICLAVLLLVTLAVKSFDFYIPKDYIARLSVVGMILEDRPVVEAIKSIKDDNNAKAMVLHVNSPGGSMASSEAIYLALKDLSEVKPVVAVFDSVAASGGYMIALGTDYIVARRGTLTGSIGVLLQMAEITELSEKLGVNIIVVKSGELKGSPSPLEKLTPKAREALHSSVMDSFNYFKEMVGMGRKMSKEQIEYVSDGRIFTGSQALESNLIDSLGGEDEAVDWLQDTKGISPDIKVIDIVMKKKKSWLMGILSSVVGDNVFLTEEFNNSGLMALWKPGLIN